MLSIKRNFAYLFIYLLTLLSSVLAVPFFQRISFFINKKSLPTYITNNWPKKPENQTELSVVNKGIIMKKNHLCDKKNSERKDH